MGPADVGRGDKYGVERLMERRTFITGAAVAATGAGGAILLSGSTAAAEIEDASFTGTSIHGESDDGSIDDVRAGAHSIGFRYEGLNDPADEATVELQVVYDGTAETIDEASTTAIGGTSKTGAALGEELEGSVLDHPSLDASDFEASADGETVRKDVRLRLKVTVTTEAGDDVTGDSDANLAVIMRNIASDANVGGEADGEIVVGAEHIGTSPENPDADVDTEGVLTVHGRNEGDRMVFIVDLEEPWSDEDEPHANVGLGFDVDGDGLWDFQVNWSSEEGIFSANPDHDLDEPDFSGEKDGEEIVFEIDADEFDGDSFDFVANSSYGGATHANVSAYPDRAWSPDDDWRSSEYFINVELTE